MGIKIMDANFCAFFVIFLFTATLVWSENRHHVDVNTEFHRIKRSTTASSGVPQPTHEFPLVLFAIDNYNNGTNSYFHRSRPNEYRVWAQTVQNGIQEFVFRSLLLFPGWKLRFQACCPSGNRWTISVSNVTNISSLHFFMFDNHHVGEGIFYTQWLHWLQEFSVKAEKCEDQESCGRNVTCAHSCYFGSCGLDGNCQCKDGYSGDDCEIRPADPSVYPNLTYPLLLFPEKNFKGTPVKVAAGSYYRFAKNEENKRLFDYLSARILFTRAIIFSRNKEEDQKFIVSPGSDINDMEAYFASNADIGDPLWYNYAATIESEFYIKVEGNSHCNNCSETGGSCYTGKCICLPGYSGTYCSG